MWLCPWSVNDASDVLAGRGGPADGLRWHPEYPMAETLDALSMLFSAHRETGWREDREPRWWISQIVLGDLVVGDIGFHGPPAAGAVEVEIGYNVVPDLRGRRIATRACGLLLELAWRDGAAVVRAETDPDNLASQRVLTAAGLVDTGDFRYRIERPPVQGSARPTLPESVPEATA